MKCIICCLVLAVAVALPVDEDQDARRRLQAVQLTLVNDVDDNQKSSSNREIDNVNRQPQTIHHGNNQEEEQNSDRYNSPSLGSEVVIGGHDLNDDSNRDDSQKGQNLDALASVLDYLTKRYQGKGVLKIFYNPVAKISKDPRVYKLGALQFTYMAPKDNDKSVEKTKSGVNRVLYLPRTVAKELKIGKYQNLLNSQKVLPSNRHPARQFLRFDDRRDYDDDQQDDDRQDDDRQDDDEQDDGGQDDETQNDDRQDYVRQDDVRQDDDRQDDDRDDDNQDK